MNILPKFCRSNATVNYSILNRFKPANIYRFFCLSLSRDDWYNVRITLDELKRTSGGKSVSSFNKKFEEYLDIKPYFVDNGYYYLTRRNIYHIPAMEELELTKANILKAIKIDEDTYEKYIIELAVVDLLLFGNPLILHTENILLENDFSKQKKLPTKKVNKIVEIDDNGNIIIPK